MNYAFLADLVLIIHASYVLFVVGGQFLILAGWAAKWQWTHNLWFRIVHLLAIGFVMLEAWAGVVCPLTTLENYLREKAGISIYQSGFIKEWVSHLLFYDAPSWVFILIYTFFFLLVLITLWFYPPRLKSY